MPPLPASGSPVVEPLFFIQRHVGPFHQIHTSEKSASISSQKAETLNRGIAGRRADLSPLSSRGVGNLNTKTPVLFIVLP
ncbi:hypothetical protein DJICPGNB_24125 [Escherichia coli]|nr:hypothetical protein DJICPGNB_24125 [Escherichia coli]